MTRAGSWIGPRLLVVMLLLGCQVACATRAFRTIPAYWVDDQQRLEPVGLDFMFLDLSFATPRDGWVVGDRYLLKISAGRPSVTFIGQVNRTWFNVVRVLKGGSAWAGGRTEEGAAVWRYTGEWRQVELPRDWRHEGAGDSDGSEGFPFSVTDGGMDDVTDMEFGDPGSGFALVLTGPYDSLRNVLLEYRRGAWRIVPLSLLQEGRARLADLCLSGDGGWAVGYVPVEPKGSRPLALRYQDGEWRATGLPEIPWPYALLYSVACDPTGGAYAAGEVLRTPPGGPIENLLLRYTDGWERVEVPDPIPGKKAGITAIALADDSLWVAMYGRDEGMLYAYRDGSWSRLPYPSVEGGRKDFEIWGIEFVSGEAWAIANDSNGPGIVRGLLLHYADGRWTNKNWNYNPWRDLWSTLFGD